jgi:hypothetical protein
MRPMPITEPHRRPHGRGLPFFRVGDREAASSNLLSGFLTGEVPPQPCRPQVSPKLLQDRFNLAGGTAKRAFLAFMLPQHIASKFYDIS